MQNNFVQILDAYISSNRVPNRKVTKCCASTQVQFHMPRLPDVLALLEALARSPCRCLRKIVDRQSRWRPRELQFEQMEEKGGTESSDSGSVSHYCHYLTMDSNNPYPLMI